MQLPLEKIPPHLRQYFQAPEDNRCHSCWICAMRVVFKEVHRVLTPTGTLWCNVGDSYVGGNQGGTYNPATWKPLDDPGSNTSWTTRQQRTTLHMASATNLKPKNLTGLPWRLALALQADGWILRSEIIWHKLNPMPESTTDRPTRAHEQVFLFSKQGRYYYDGEAVRESSRATTNRSAYGETSVLTWKHSSSHGGSKPNHWARQRLDMRAMRSVLSLASEPCHFAHFATFPTELVRKCLLAGAPTQVCAQCQAPWVRQVEREIPHDSGRGLSAKYRQNGAFRGDTTRRLGRHYQDQLSTHPPQTLGFLPTCACAAPTKPCTVLDPFVGSGTVLQVARELGLHGIGVDLSWEYVKNIARERLGLADLHRWSHGATPQPVSYTDLPLFAEDLRCR